MNSDKDAQIVLVADEPDQQQRRRRRRRRYATRSDDDNDDDSSDDDDAAWNTRRVVYREIAMPGCDRAALLCMVVTTLVVLIFAIAAYVKADMALAAIQAGASS